MDTRDRVLDYLQEHRTTTIPNLSKLWGLTRADIRHHINNLIKEGLVDKVSHVKPDQTKRGRPEYEYHLSSQSGDDNYHNLCATLLKMILRDCPVENQGNVMTAVAQEIAGNPVNTPSFTHAMNSTVAWLNERGYHSRWEAAAGGPRLMFLHCPYALLLPEHPELCQLDILVLERLLSIRIQQTARMDFRSNLARACIFESSG
jgi:predicted ArsR family transcriptional regulator